MEHFFRFIIIKPHPLRLYIPLILHFTQHETCSNLILKACNFVTTGVFDRSLTKKCGQDNRRAWAHQRAYSYSLPPASTFQNKQHVINIMALSRSILIYQEDGLLIRGCMDPYALFLTESNLRIEENWINAWCFIYVKHDYASYWKYACHTQRSRLEPDWLYVSRTARCKYVHGQ